jgi:AraC-like DNA-binding protein
VTNRPRTDEPRAFSFRTPDVDEAREFTRSHYYANRFDLLDPASTPAFAFDVVHHGPVTIGEADCGADLRMSFGELGAYHVNVPLRGTLAWSQRPAGERLSTPETAAVFQPVGDTVLHRWSSDCRLIAVKIGRPALEGELARMIDGPVRGPVRFANDLDLTAGPGRTWAGLVRLLAAEGANPAGLSGHPLIGPALRESLLRGLLLAAEHPYRHRLADAGRPPAPRAVRRAIDAIRDRPGHPYTVKELAAVAGVSDRRLQEGFQRHAGMSPMAYLREVRLERAHEELRRAAPGTTVADVAFRWGFVHLGRFAARYRARYGRSPSEILRYGA